MLTNLRMGPFELAADIGMDYNRWYLEHLFAFAPAGAYARSPAFQA
jgi:3-hydroxyacyl-CoA dehydrogenase